MTGNVKMLPKIEFYKDPETGKRAYTFALFFPEHKANVGMIECYAHIGQHSEASQDYFLRNTLKASPTNIAKCGLDAKDLGALMTEWAWLGRTKAEGPTPYDLIERDSAAMQRKRWNRA